MASVFEHFLAKTPGAAAAKPVDFSGKWRNQLRSEMELTVKGNKVTGKYRTGVGLPTPAEEFDLTGFCSGDLLAFVVNFGKFGSLTAWAGQHTIDDVGQGQIRTMWHLAKNVKDEDEPSELWAAVLSGADVFFR
jgi:hypothetical protein